MVEAKIQRTRTKTNYINGSVAYDLEPEISPIIKKKSNKALKNKNLIKYKMIGKIVIIFLLSFLLVYRFTLIMSNTYNIRNIKTQISQLSGDNENIRIDLAQMNNIKNIEEIATVNRGMIVPDNKDIRFISVKPLTLASGTYSQSAFQMVQKLMGLIN